MENLNYWYSDYVTINSNYIKTFESRRNTPDFKRRIQTNTKYLARSQKQNLDYSDAFLDL